MTTEFEGRLNDRVFDPNPQFTLCMNHIGGKCMHIDGLILYQYHTLYRTTDGAVEQMKAFEVPTVKDTRIITHHGNNKVHVAPPTLLHLAK